MSTLEFGRKLRSLREKCGMTQNQLAKHIGVSKATVSLYELHERLPTADVLTNAAQLFHVSADYLLGIDKNRRIDVSELDEKEIEAIEHIVKVLVDNKKK